MTEGDRERRPGPEVVSPLEAWAVAGWIGALVGWAAVAPAAPRSVVVGGGVVAVAIVGLVGLARSGRASGAGARGHSDRSPWTTLVGVVLAALVVGTTAWWRGVALDAGPLSLAAHRGGAVEVLATVATEPSPRPDGTAWTIVVVTRVDDRDGRWRALVAGIRDPPPVGTGLVATTTARPLGDGGFAAMLRRRHVGVALDADDRGWRVVHPPTGVLRRVEQVRAAVRAGASAGLDGDGAALAVGLVTGDTRGLSAAAEAGMQATGLSHLVAVSGSNVALVLALVAVLSARLPPTVRRLLVVAAVAAFTVTTRLEPSVLRAAAMVGMVLLARVRGVPIVPRHALSGAVLCLVVLDPASAGSLGLVLSALATAGVLVVAPRVAAGLPRRLPRRVALLLAATVGAQAAVTPVLLATVGEVPLASVPANLVAVPAAAVASLVAVVGAVFAQVHVGAAAVVFACARPALAVVLAVAQHLRGPVLSAARPALLVAATLAVVAVAARPGGPTRRRAARLLVAVLLVVGMPSVVPGAWTGRDVPAGVLSVTAIDVGQGDAVLVTTGSGHRLLVDAGGDDRAAAWLRRHGITALDVVVLSHPHADHVGGLPDLLAAVHVGVVWHAPDPGDGPGLPPDVPTTRGPQPLPVDDVAAVPVSAGMSAELGSARVEVLGPPPGWELVATEGGPNDRSVVLRVVEGDRVALLTGDVESAAQDWLLAHGGDLRASLLKVPHHGAATTDPEFLAAVAPRVGLVSVGADNDYGHPAPDLLRWLADLDVRVHRTDLEGTVSVAVPARPP